MFAPFSCLSSEIKADMACDDGYSIVLLCLAILCFYAVGRKPRQQPNGVLHAPFDDGNVCSHDLGALGLGGRSGGAQAALPQLRRRDVEQTESIPIASWRRILSSTTRTCRRASPEESSSLHQFWRASVTTTARFRRSLPRETRSSRASNGLARRTDHSRDDLQPETNYVFPPPTSSALRTASWLNIGTSLTVCLARLGLVSFRHRRQRANQSHRKRHSAQERATQGFALVKAGQWAARASAGRALSRGKATARARGRSRPIRVVSLHPELSAATQGLTRVRHDRCWPKADTAAPEI